MKKPITISSFTQKFVWFNNNNSLRIEQLKMAMAKAKAKSSLRVLGMVALLVCSVFHGAVDVRWRKKKKNT